MQTTEAAHAEIHIATKDLPLALKVLLNKLGKRPKSVEVVLTVAPTSVTENYMAQKTASFGEILSTRDAGWVGSDSEFNPATQVTYSAPAAQVRGFGKHAYVTIRVGNVPESLIAALHSEKTRLAVLEVAVDASLEGVAL